MLQFNKYRRQISGVSAFLTFFLHLHFVSNTKLFYLHLNTLDFSFFSSLAWKVIQTYAFIKCIQFYVSVMAWEALIK